MNFTQEQISEILFDLANKVMSFFLQKTMALDIGGVKGL